MSDADPVERFLATHHPFDMLGEQARAEAAAGMAELAPGPGETLYRAGDPVPGLFVIAAGAVEIVSPDGATISLLALGECFGERGLLRDGVAPVTARMREGGRLYRLAPELFNKFIAEEPDFARFFGRGPATPEARAPGGDIALMTIGELMTADPVSVPPATSVAEAAAVMTGRGISCVLVAEGDRLSGIITASDLCARVLARGLSGETPVAAVMTRDPVALPADAIGLDAVTTMIERGIGHLPVVEGRRAVGIVTRTNLLLSQALSVPVLLGKIARGRETADLAEAIAQVPQFLAQLVGTGAEAHVVSRLVTDLTDALTRRLIALAEDELGPPPVPYLWAVCGSQGRQEQTGISDQDNCLMHDAYFADLARRVSDGLNACGFVYCPGEMMATNPRWRQPIRVWREYFAGWIRTPDPMAQMLASVMFDLRAVAGESALLAGLHEQTLAAARANSIFVSHMVRNALTHQPPLGLFRGFALIRSGEHKNAIDMKLNGVVPVVDLARLYALMGGIRPVNTRARLIAAREQGVVSEGGGADLLDAYDLIAEMRLAHQAALVREGRRPDNFLQPALLSELERGHLKDAFTVIKTMQAALAQGRHTLA